MQCCSLNYSWNYRATWFPSSYSSSFWSRKSYHSKRNVSVSPFGSQILPRSLPSCERMIEWPFGDLDPARQQYQGGQYLCVLNLCSVYGDIYSIAGIKGWEWEWYHSPWVWVPRWQESFIFCVHRLGQVVPRYLVKHYSGCVSQWFWMRLPFEFADSKQVAIPKVSGPYWILWRSEENRECWGEMYSACLQSWVSCSHMEVGT